MNGGLSGNIIHTSGIFHCQIASDKNGDFTDILAGLVVSVRPKRFFPKTIQFGNGKNSPKHGGYFIHSPSHW
jgi:hypothetical protein